MIDKIKKMFSKNKKNDLISEYESPVRSLVSKAHGITYNPIKNLEEAKKYIDSYMIMEGDFGGQIYLTIPVRQIKCDYKQLKILLTEIDEMGWDCDDGVRIYFERKKTGEGIPGGMKGGVTNDNLWVHKRLSKIKGKILSVLIGKSKSINN